MRKLTLALAAVLLAACGTSTVHARPAIATAPSCGTERWPVKTGTGPGAAAVDTGTVVPSTIAALDALPAPSVLPQDARVAPVEDTVYQVTGTLTEFKLEADQDIHLVLADAQGHTMIAEIPDPACVGSGSPFLPGITAARAAFTARYTPTASFTHVSVPVTVTGVGFFDPEHGQTGAAVLAGGQVTIELHPVLSISFGQP